jgi:hypothetical protein
MVDLSGIHFHDCQIRRVVEDLGLHSLTMEVSYPTNWEANEFSSRSLVFLDCFNYQVFELPFDGLSTILDAEVVGQEEDWDKWSKIRLETNVGRRELICREVRLV